MSALKYFNTRSPIIIHYDLKPGPPSPTVFQLFCAAVPSTHSKLTVAFRLDICPYYIAVANVLLVDGHVKITDFGLSKEMIGQDDSGNIELTSQVSIRVANLSFHRHSLFLLFVLDKIEFRCAICVWQRVCVCGRVLAHFGTCRQNVSQSAHISAAKLMYGPLV
jgi:prepilin-type processing-associated H-X9-DG protein